MRTLRFTFTAAGQRKWIVDADATLFSFNSTDSSAILTSDPKQTVAEFITPTSNRTDLDIVGTVYSPGGTKIPIYKNQELYLNISAAGFIIIVLDDPIPTSAE